jgi:ABC-type metal ion transport system substrate-binding protein
MEEEDILTRKIIWLIVSCLMAVSLVVASCGPAAEEEEEEEVSIGEEEEEEEEQEVEVTEPDKPRYGGTINIALAREITNWAHVLEFC